MIESFDKGYTINKQSNQDSKTNAITTTLVYSAPGYRNTTNEVNSTNKEKKSALEAILQDMTLNIPGHTYNKYQFDYFALVNNNKLIQ